MLTAKEAVELYTEGLKNETARKKQEWQAYLTSEEMEKKIRKACAKGEPHLEVSYKDTDYPGTVAQQLANEVLAPLGYEVKLQTTNQTIRIVWCWWRVITNK